jgi:hypothetical protein
MECWTVKRKVSAYLDNAIPEDESREIRQHLWECQVCTQESERYQRIREALRSLPKRVPPPDLTMRLRVAASRAKAESAGPGIWMRWRNRAQLTLASLMRPVALPLVGGLCSALFLFSAFVAPTFTSARASGATQIWDVPTMLSTQPMMRSTGPIGFGDGDADVDFKIDEQGRIVNYAIVSADHQSDQLLRRRIENGMLFTEFWPATAFGRPIAGTVRISLRNRSRIEVKG